MQAIPPRPKTAQNQSGINIVDLMMWLLVAALLLAAAIQSIGYYQKSSTLYELSNDVSNAGQNVMTEAANNNGILNTEVVARGIAATEKTDDTTIFTKFVRSNGVFTITATSPRVSGIKVIYSSSSRDGLNPGVNRINDDGATTYPSGEGLSGVTSTQTMILNSNTNYCLDNAWNGIAANNKVIYHECNGGLNQQWEWDGNSQIKLKQDPSLCFDINKDTKLSQLSKCSTSSSQIFQTIDTSNNEFSLFQPSSNQCLMKTVDPTYSTHFRLTLANCDAPEMTRWKHILK